MDETEESRKSPSTSPGSFAPASDCLKDVVAYVEVRTAHDNRSSAVQRVLEQLGAKVVDKFTDAVTHVIFKEGKKRTHDRAVKRKVHLLSVLWVDRCRETLERVPESLFPANTDCITSPVPGLRWKRYKSMQPRDYDEVVRLSAEKCEKRRKRIAHANRFRFDEESTPYNSPGQILVLETQPRSPFLGIALQSPSSITIPNTPPSMQARIDQLQRLKAARKASGDLNQLQSPLCTNAEPEQPLQRKLFGSGTSLEKEELMENSPTKTSKASSGSSLETVKTNEGTSAAVIAPSSKSLAKNDAVENATGDESSVPSVNAECNPASSSELPVSEKANGSSKDSCLPNESTSSRVSDPISKQVPAKRQSRRSVRLSMSTVSKLPFAVSGIETSTAKASKQGGSLPNSVQKKTDSESKKRHRTKSDPESVKNVAQKKMHGRKSMGAVLSSTSQAKEREDDSNEKMPKQKEKSVASSNSSEGNDNSSPSEKSDETYAEKAREQCSVFESEEKAGASKRGGGRRKSVMNTESMKTVGVEGRTKSQSLSCNASNSGAAESTKSDKTTSKTSESDKHLVRSVSNSTVKKRKLLNPSQDLHIPSPAQTKTSKTDGSESDNAESKRGKKRTLFDVNDVFPDSSPAKRGRKSLQSKENKSRKRASKDGASEDKSCEEMDEEKKRVTLKRASSQRRGRTTEESESENDSVLSSSNANSILGASMSMVFDESSASSSLIQRFAPSRPSIAEFQPNRFYRRGKSKRQISLSSVSENETSSGSGEERSRRRVSSQQQSHLSGKPSIVMTSLHRPEQELVISVVRKLGSFFIEDNVSSQTTHLVCGKPRRTLNVLHAIARGCWIVSKEWALRSLEAEKWLPEEEFELVQDFPRAKVTRQAREEAAPAEYKSAIFEKAGSIFVSHTCTPPRSQLITLLRLSGAKVTDSVHRADLHVGDECHADKTSVKPLWVLDCVTHQELLPLDDYDLSGAKAKVSSSPEF